MKENSKTTEVTDYKLFNNCLCYKVGKELKGKYLVCNGFRIELKGVTGYQITDSKIYFSSWEDGNFEFDLTNRTLISSNFGRISDVRGEQYLFFSEDDKTRIFEINQGKIISSIDTGIVNLKSLVLEKFIFTVKDGIILNYNLPTAQLLWQFDLSHLGTYKSSSNENKPYEVKKIIGVWQDYLIISLTNDELLIIKSKDGQFVNKLNKIPLQKMAEYTVDYLGSCMMLDQAEGKIKGFVNFVFWEFNLSNFTFECFNLAETIAQNNLSSLMNITSFAQSVTHYFVTMLKIDDTGSMTSYLVALNKQTKNFDWKYEIPWTGNNAPQYSGNKLYQLDNLHTLHIFQNT